MIRIPRDATSDSDGIITSSKEAKHERDQHSAHGTRGRALSRTDTNFWLDVSLLVLFLALIFVSVVVRFVFPPAMAAEGVVLWGGSLAQWMDLQFGLLGLFSFGVLLHLMLHWNWVCGVVTTRLLSRIDGKRRSWDEGTKTIVGVGLMIVLLNIIGLLVAAAALSIQKPL